MIRIPCGDVGIEYRKDVLTLDQPGFGDRQPDIMSRLPYEYKSAAVSNIAKSHSASGSPQQDCEDCSRLSGAGSRAERLLRARERTDLLDLSEARIEASDQSHFWNQSH